MHVAFHLLLKAIGINCGDSFYSSFTGKHEVILQITSCLKTIFCEIFIIWTELNHLKENETDMCLRILL